MTERLVIERDDATGGLHVTLTTAVGSLGELTITKFLASAADLSQHRVLELQADLLAEAVAVLGRKLAQARQGDSSAPPRP